jgi:hypothetical protein
MPSPASPPTRARRRALRSVLGAPVVAAGAGAVAPPAAAATIGFQATHTGDSGRPAPFTLNGAMCTVA